MIYDTCPNCDGAGTNCENCGGIPGECDCHGMQRQCSRCCGSGCDDVAEGEFEQADLEYCQEQAEAGLSW